MRCFLALSEDWTSEKKESVQAGMPIRCCFLCTCCGYKGDADHTAGINIKARYLDKNLSKICEDNKYNHKVLQSKLSGYYSRKNELYKQQHPEKFVKKQNSEEQAASAT